jgi:hypothetical protein
MIAKSTWFSPRKFGGWGLTPNCWQGWAYIGIIVLLLAILGSIKLPGFWSTGLMLTVGIIFSLDFIDIFIHLKKDERDILHEALAERNAMWFMVATLGIGIAYQASSNNIDPIILIALFGSMIIKAATHWMLHNK